MPGQCVDQSREVVIGPDRQHEENRDSLGGKPHRELGAAVQKTGAGGL